MFDSVGAAPAAPDAAAGGSQGDDLTKITGIGEATAAKLKAEGYDSYVRIANLTVDEVEQIEEKLKVKGVKSWVEQATDLATAPPPMAKPKAKAVKPPEDKLTPAEENRVAAALKLSAEQAPADPRDTVILQMQKMLEEQGRQLKALMASTTVASSDAGDGMPRRRRAPPVQRRARVMAPASEDGPRRRLDIHDKYSEIIGSDPELPPGAVYQQVVTENGEERVAYFGGDRIQRYYRDDDASDLDYDDVEDEKPATLENLNLRHWMDGKVDYPIDMVLKVMKKRFAFDGRTKRDAQEELHRIMLTNRA